MKPDQDVLTQMDADKQQAILMSAIEAPEDLLNLVNRLSSHLEFIMNLKAKVEFRIADERFKIDKLDASKKAIEQYIMVGKQRYKELIDNKRFNS